MVSLLCALLTAVFILAGGACQNNNAERKLVATVNGDKIYLDEFQKELKIRKTRLGADTFDLSPEQLALLESEILEAMITEKIILHRAGQLNLSVTSTELEKKIIDIRSDYDTIFFDLLARQNISYDDWRDSLRKEMLIDKVVEADVNAAIRVSEDEAEDYFNDHPEFCKTPARVRASQIVLRDMDQARAAADRLHSGKDFARVAADVSIGPEAAAGGDLGFIERGTMPEPLDIQLFSLPVDKISPVVQTEYGYHIVKVTRIQQARARPFTECKEEIMAAIRAKKEDAAFNAWLDALRLKAVVKREAIAYRP